MSLSISDILTCKICGNLEACRNNQYSSYNLYGESYAVKCDEFINKSSRANELKIQNALNFMLAGQSEFTMLSLKTGNKLRYKILSKKKSNEESNQNKYVYWLYTENKSGTLWYAGLLFFDEKDKQFKYAKGARGKVDKSDIFIKSILFVLNSLYNKRYNSDLVIFHTGKCGVCGRSIDNNDLGIDNICKSKIDIPK